MIGPSDLYRVPLSVQSTQREDLRRYARLELQSMDLAWSAPSSRPTDVRGTGIRGWLSSHFGVLRTRAPSASTGNLHPGLAAVHFGGDALVRTPEPKATTPMDHPCDVLATSALILTVQPKQPGSEDVCVCDH